MKLYFSGITNTDQKVMLELGVERVLYSFYYIKNSVDRHVSLEKNYSFKDIFLDSGAFSAWASGKYINIDDYAKFIIDHECKVYANLDSIGSWEKTLANQRTLEGLGLNPLPVFHLGESFSVLDAYCNSYDYVCLGGLAGDASDFERNKWLDVCFSSYPKKKFHGFAVTSERLMKRYPFYSVDSTTWNVLRKFGELTTSAGRIYVGDDKEHESHIDNLNKEDLEDIKSFCDSLGISFEKIKNGTDNERIKLCIKFFLDLEKRLTDNPPVIQSRQLQMSSFFGQKKTILSDMKTNVKSCPSCRSSNFSAVALGEKKNYCYECGEVFV